MMGLSVLARGLQVSAQGYGCMGLSAYYATGGFGTEEDALLVISAALESGITLFDTADVYGFGHNELLLGKAIKKYGRDKFVVATKFGVRHDPVTWETTICGTPEYVRWACESSLARLGISTIDLYYQHRVDKSTPIEVTVNALAELVKEGKVRHLGLCECSAETLRRAHAIHPIAAVQVEFSLWTPDFEDSLFPTCRELGVGIVAYSPLGRGFLSGTLTSPEDLSEDDWRRQNPRFESENFAKNLDLVEKVGEIALSKGVTSSQLALAWVQGCGGDIVAIPGTRNPLHLKENVASVNFFLSEDDDKILRTIMAGVSGLRYPEFMMESCNV